MSQMLISLDSLQEQNVEIGELLTVVVVKAANVLKDIKSGITDLVGGRVKHYENLIQSAVDTALKELEEKAKDRGYDGIIGLKISNPMVMNGGVEIVVYGNGFRKRKH